MPKKKGTGTSQVYRILGRPYQGGLSASRVTTVRPHGVTQEIEARIARRMHVTEAASLAEEDVLRSLQDDTYPQAMDMDGGVGDFAIHESGSGAEPSNPAAEDDAWEDYDEDIGLDEPGDGDEAGMRANDALDEVFKILPAHVKRKDHRTRHDRIQAQDTAWNAIYDDLVNAYLRFDLSGAPPESPDGPLHDPICSIDLFGSELLQVPYNPEEDLTVTLARYGLVASAPLKPANAFTTRTLELFCSLTSRSPQLSAQNYIKSLCELQMDTYSPHLRSQFVVACDAYLEIKRRIAQRLNDELGRQDPLWRLKNACACCTYTLEGETPLQYSVLLSVDGNNSLKRVERTRLGLTARPDAPDIVHVTNIEREDPRDIKSDLFIPQAAVELFSREVKQRKPKKKSNECPDPALEEPSIQEEASVTAGAEETDPCVQRWTNLGDDSQKKMWSMFKETGIFLAACRHGVVLSFCDMVKSGELAKYPLAIVSHLLDALGDRLLIGYDIGCGFTSTASHSALVGPKVRKSGSRFCVGSFHGHAHNRQCQLDYHPQYIQGTGLEDFETCERVFSASNACARCSRYMSEFHRRQLILRFYDTWNEEKYQELSRFLINNFDQATQLIRELPTKLQRAHEKNNGYYPDYAEWLATERSYLKAVEDSPPVAVGRLEYLRTLQLKYKADREYTEKMDQLAKLRRQDIDNPANLQARKLEQARAGGMDNLLLLNATLNRLEVSLGIEKRWTPDCSEWREMADVAAFAEYRDAVDNLEYLVVSRLFELTKMNQSATGYKLRHHIGNALKVRSNAIQRAIQKYNKAAAKLPEPRDELKWSSVAKYAFLADFDLLRLSRSEITKSPWTKPAERVAQSQHFKLLRAREEIERVYVESRRLHTYIVNEEAFLKSQLATLQGSKPELAVQLHSRLTRFKAVNDVHRKRLALMFRRSGFEGAQTTGIRQGSMASDGNVTLDHLDSELGDFRLESGGDEDDDEAVANAVQVLQETLHLDS